MNIGIDGRVFEGKPTGVGRFCRDLILEAAIANPVHRYLIITRGDCSYRTWPENIKIVEVHFPSSNRLKPIIWLKLSGAGLIRLRLDRYLATSVFLPFFLKRETEVISVVHDFNHLIVPSTMRRGNLAASRMFFARDLNRADKLITNSQATADKLFQYFRRTADAVVHPRIPENLMAGISGTLVKPRERIVLAVSTLEPRKNIEVLIRAFQDSEKMRMLNYQLYLVGKDGWGASARFDRTDPRIVFTGYLDDPSLRSLYQRAEVYYMPSLYEGFGIPVREALAFGCPVVCSDIPELQESSSGTASYIQPTYEGIKSSLDNRIWLQNIDRPMVSFGFSDGEKSAISRML